MGASADTPLLSERSSWLNPQEWVLLAFPVFLCITVGVVKRALLYLIFPLALFCGAALLWREPYLLLGLLAAESALMLGLWHTREDLFFYLVPFVVGPSAEIIAIHGGAWSYAEPQWYIPVWLPLGWGISGLFMKKAARALLG
jgi:uncharacterized membrane protein YoaT (DUF817 family)